MRRRAAAIVIGAILLVAVLVAGHDEPAPGDA